MKMAKTFIIAEAGVNHNGSIELAKKLIDVAVDAKCDAVKFQTFKAENVISKKAKKAQYQEQTTGASESQLEMVKKLELSFDQFRELKKYCEQKKIMFLSTPFDHESIDFLASLGMKIFKIPSGEITNLPYLRKINSLKTEVILSTGMANLAEIAAALKILKNCCVTILHANTEYPTPFEDVNLRAMKTIADKFKTKIGYSDHSLGIEVPVAAVALGASIIEKHFTLDQNMEGPDHKASLNPQQLKEMVVSIRNIEKSLGNGKKIPSKSETKNIAIARKSIIAKRAIKKGEIFSEKNLTVKRPGNGISPMKWDEIIGTKAKKNYEEDDLI
jgi:N,N'-diacetyllegionaminate synthase